MIAKLYVLQSIRTTYPIRCGEVLANKMSAILSAHFVDIEDSNDLFTELQIINTELVTLAGPAVIHAGYFGHAEWKTVCPAVGTRI